MIFQAVSYSNNNILGTVKVAGQESALFPNNDDYCI